MRKKNVLSLLLAVVLALSLPPPARGAGDPWLNISTESDGSQSVSLNGLSGACWGVQVTLTLNQTADAFAFDEAFYGPGVYCKAAQGAGQITVYIVSKSALGESGTLRLGSLPGSCAVTGASNLKVLDLVNPEGAAYPSPVLSQQGQTGSQPGNPNLPAVPSQPGGQNPPSGSGQPSDSTLRYRVDTPSGLENGSVTSSALWAQAGDTVVLTVLPAAGWTLERLVLTDSSGREVSWTDLGLGQYRFTMPRSDLSVQAAFRALDSGDSGDSGTPQTPPLPFLDVPSHMWYYDAISYASQMGLMNGMKDGLFEPDGTTTRAQIVTILHRLEGEPLSTVPSAFSDAPASQWYIGAVDWASETGIVDGYGDGRFGPDDPITREQMALILYRYARWKGFDVSAIGDLRSFADLDSLSPWAVEAMEWANGSSLITGKAAGILDPQGQATRAEAATILMRFREGFAV